MRSKSLSKPQLASLSALGIEIRASDWQTDKPEKLDQLFSASDIVISTVNAEARLDQKILVDAAKRANVKRFIPCEFRIVCVPGVIDIFDKVKSNLMKSLHKRYLYETVGSCWKSESISKTQAFRIRTSASGCGTNLLCLTEEL